MDMNKYTSYRRIIHTVWDTGSHSDTDFEYWFEDVLEDYFYERQDIPIEEVGFKHFLRLMTRRGFYCLDCNVDPNDLINDVKAFINEVCDDPHVQKFFAEQFDFDNYELPIRHVLENVLRNTPSLEGEQYEMIKQHIKLLFLGWAWLGDGEGYIWDADNKT